MMIGRSLEEFWKNELRCEVFSSGCFYGQLGVWEILLCEGDGVRIKAEIVRKSETDVAIVSLSARAGPANSCSRKSNFRCWTVGGWILDRVLSTSRVQCTWTPS